MVNQLDNNNKKNLSVEELYVVYQHNRPVAAQTNNQDSDLQKSVVMHAAMEDDSLLAETLYKHYQATRGTDAQGSIDAIVQKVEQHTISRMLKQEEQPFVPLDVPQIHKLDAKRVTEGDHTQFEAPAANNASIWKRWVIPGVAVAILSVVFVPMMMNSDSGPEELHATLPTALSDQAAQSVAYIEVPKNGSLAFAGTTNAAQVAFINGVIVTDLTLLVEADQIVKTQQMLRALLAAQSTAQHDSTSKIKDDLSAKVHSNALGMSDAIDTGKNKTVLVEQLADIGSGLEAIAKKSDQLDWYLAGRSVESIRVAAQYALDKSDITPLKQALLLGNKLDQPKSQAPASGTLAQLLQADLSGPEEFVKAAELLDMANDIKLLMQ